MTFRSISSCHRLPIKPRRKFLLLFFFPRVTASIPPPPENIFDKKKKSGPLPASKLARKGRPHKLWRRFTGGTDRRQKEGGRWHTSVSRKKEKKSREIKISEESSLSLSLSLSLLGSKYFTAKKKTRFSQGRKKKHPSTFFLDCFFCSHAVSL